MKVNNKNGKLKLPKKKGNKMNTKMKLAGIILGAALTTTSAFAGTTEKGSCGAGKCGGDMKKTEKKAGSCGAGKCGSK